MWVCWSMTIVVPHTTFCFCAGVWLTSSAFLTMTKCSEPSSFLPKPQHEPPSRRQRAS